MEPSHYWPQGDNLIKLVRGPLGDATYQISKLPSLVKIQPVV